MQLLPEGQKALAIIKDLVGKDEYDKRMANISQTKQDLEKVKTSIGFLFGMSDPQRDFKGEACRDCLSSFDKIETYSDSVTAGCAAQIKGLLLLIPQRFVAGIRAHLSS